MIRELIRMIHPGKRWFTPSLRMVICIPSGITPVEQRAVRDSAEHAGGKEVYLLHEPMAAAIGIGIDVEEPMGNLVVDIGGGTTDIAVIALGGIVCDNSFAWRVMNLPPILRNICAASTICLLVKEQQNR